MNGHKKRKDATQRVMYKYLLPTSETYFGAILSYAKLQLLFCIMYYGYSYRYVFTYKIITKRINDIVDTLFFMLILKFYL